MFLSFTSSSVDGSQQLIQKVVCEIWKEEVLWTLTGSLNLLPVSKRRELNYVIQRERGLSGLLSNTMPLNVRNQKEKDGQTEKKKERKTEV